MEPVKGIANRVVRPTLRERLALFAPVSPQA